MVIDAFRLPFEFQNFAFKVLLLKPPFIVPTPDFVFGATLAGGPAAALTAELTPPCTADAAGRRLKRNNYSKPVHRT